MQKKGIADILLDNHTLQRYVAWISIALLILAKFTINHGYNYYSPILSFLLALWILISLLLTKQSEVVKAKYDEDEERTYQITETIQEKNIRLRRKLEIGVMSSKLVNLAAIIVLSATSYAIYSKGGIIFSLILLVIVCFASNYFAFIFTRKFNPKLLRDRNDINRVLIASIIGLFFYLWAFKRTFCIEFGTPVIGSFFEKDTYPSKYFVVIQRQGEYDTEYKLPADIIVSDNFSEFESYETEGGAGAYTYETTAFEETRHIKLLKVYFENGGYLTFQDCFVPIDNSYDCECFDQDDELWKIEMTKDKVK